MRRSHLFLAGLLRSAGAASVAAQDMMHGARNMMRFAYDGIMFLAPEHSAAFSPSALKDHTQPTIFLDGSGFIGRATDTFERTDATVGALGGIAEVVVDDLFPTIDATVVVPVNEGISIGGIASITHSSTRSVTTLTDYNAASEDEVTTQYSPLSTDYKAGALFLLRALGLDIGATAAIDGSTSPANEKFDWTVDGILNETYATLGSTQNEITRTGFDAQAGARRHSSPLSLDGSVLAWQGTTDTVAYDSDASGQADAIRTNTAEMQAGSYPNWAELDQVSDFITRLYAYALFDLSEMTTLIGAASYDLVNTSRDLTYSWMDSTSDQSQSDHTLDSSLTAGRVNVGLALALALALPNDTHLRVGGGVEVDQQRRTNNDLDVNGDPAYVSGNTGRLAEFNSSGFPINNNGISGIGGSMTSAATTTFHLQAACVWYPGSEIALFGRASASFGNTDTTYDACDTFDDTVYSETTGTGSNAWDATAVFGAAFTPFELVTIGIETGTSLFGGGSSVDDNLPTGTNVTASTDLWDQNDWSFFGSANVQIRVN